jgi:hypothetical protein
MLKVNLQDFVCLLMHYYIVLHWILEIVLPFVIYFGIMGFALDFGNFCLCCSALSTSFVILQGERASGSRSYRSPSRSPQGGQHSSGSRGYRFACRSPQGGQHPSVSRSYRSPQRGYSSSE